MCKSEPCFCHFIKRILTTFHLHPIANLNVNQTLVVSHCNKATMVSNSHSAATSLWTKECSEKTECYRQISGCLVFISRDVSSSSYQTLRLLAALQFGGNPSLFMGTFSCSLLEPRRLSLDVELLSTPRVFNIQGVLTSFCRIASELRCYLVSVLQDLLSPSHLLWVHEGGRMVLSDCHWDLGKFMLLYTSRWL